MYLDDSLLPFLRFSNRRQQIEHDYGISEQIYIPNGFPFGLKTHTIAYVSKCHF